MEIISYEHGWLAPAMTEVLENFTDRELNEFVESKVWSELEGIRINGALVGLLAAAPSMCSSCGYGCLCGKMVNEAAVHGGIRIGKEIP